MFQEMESAKFFQQYLPAGASVGRKRAAGSSNSKSAARRIFRLVLWVAILGGGGYMAYNAVNGEHQGANPVLNKLSSFMGMVDPKWDERIERQMGSNPQPDPSTPGNLENPDLPESPDLEDTSNRSFLPKLRRRFRQ
jgi:hypothetical protein